MSDSVPTLGVETPAQLLAIEKRVWRLRVLFKCLLILPACVVFACVSSVSQADLSGKIGGGNIGHNHEDPEVLLGILGEIGAGMCRLPVHPNQYGLVDGKPDTKKLDRVVLSAYRHGIEPLLLFEFYTAWGVSIRGYQEWYEIGKYFATRYAPNSQWLIKNGVENWGVRYYSAINEPSLRNKRLTPTLLSPAQYIAALEGLANGVHSVDKRLRVSPGGWAEMPLSRGENPYPKAVAPLYNDGTLHAICIHRYWDIDHVPMQGRYDWSLQSQFEDVKREAGITADIAFYTDEMNFKLRAVTEEQAAQGFLTALWDALTVVGNDGELASEFVMPWNVFHLRYKDKSYGLCTSQRPWQPVRRGEVLRMVCQLTIGMELVSVDPQETGVSVLMGNGKKMWVWQNRKAWTDRPGNSFRISEMPKAAKEIEVYGWDGLRRTIPVKHNAATVIEGLQAGETYMFLSRSE